MTGLRALFPWTLFAASLATNVLLWHNNAHRSSPLSPPTSHTPSASSPRPLPSSAVNSVSSPTPVTSPVPSVTLHSTASRSTAFSGYADLLAEDIKTQEQIDALNHLLARWVATDPTAAASWLAHYDDAPFYDPAALHITNHLVGTQRFAEASIWADLIRDPSLRETAREAIIAESFRAKKIDASAVRLSDLPAPRIEAILNGSRLD
jgi:hypothetical protein